ncbi:MAG: FecR family protein, partial [Morganella morganii]
MTDRREQDEREDAAALWFTRWHSQSMTAQQQRELQAWLAASPENRQAFDDMALLWREMSALPRPEITEQAPARAFPLLRPLRHTLAGLFILVMLFLPYSQLPALLMDNLTLATAAESKSMILPDGSRIFLSRDSEADITYEQTHRRISLVRGTAFFQVKSNPWRPFVIRADGREITVVGTEFDVSRRGTEVAVSVANGIVALRDAPDEKPVYLRAGDKAVSPAQGAALLLSHIPPEQAGEWRNGQITLTDTPLRDVVARLAPYSN